MENKDRYLKALIENRGQLNEIDLGEKIQLEEEETREIIAQLLYEHRVIYQENVCCAYNVK
ncbi:hypothetical protein MAR621_00498 [Maribacter dokdonensis]|uniref:hypothetical protein n=1 Tax=Maribacter dokdonensis TaxID=320912 RepID=UPI001B0A9CFE|nr:hypothetical protein [Maribacter dokdonensis]CAG2534676.1 hypothetical protein MAR621_00498 [Maribacter dokdonensis]